MDWRSILLVNPTPRQCRLVADRLTVLLATLRRGEVQPDGSVIYRPGAARALLKALEPFIP